MAAFHVQLSGHRIGCVWLCFIKGYVLWMDGLLPKLVDAATVD